MNEERERVRVKTFGIRFRCNSLLILGLKIKENCDMTLDV
jgi:hypothetical protein